MFERDSSDLDRPNREADASLLQTRIYQSVVGLPVAPPLVSLDDALRRRPFIPEPRRPTAAFPAACACGMVSIMGQDYLSVPWCCARTAPMPPTAATPPTAAPPTDATPPIAAPTVALEPLNIFDLCLLSRAHLTAS
jgi:hypothetical protein